MIIITHGYEIEMDNEEYSGFWNESLENQTTFISSASQIFTISIDWDSHYFLHHLFLKRRQNFDFSSFAMIQIEVSTEAYCNCTTKVLDLRS